ncbi:MAG: DUF2148 domain-containing protein [Candidatus Omnitrophota bacterium]
MPRNYENIKRSALKSIAEKMCVSARTAPKAKGVDNLVITIIEKENKRKLALKMISMGKKLSRPGFIRDAAGIKASDIVVLIGTKSSPIGLNCGFCGYPTCLELSKSKGMCSYNSLDLGIALGSSVSIASLFNADNRMMYSAGKAAMACGFLKGCVMAIGIPLSASGKNPFFDRK